MITNTRLVFLAAVITVAVLIVFTTGFQSSPDIASADPGMQMMGGGMGNDGGMQGMRHQMKRDNVPPGVKPQDLPAPNSKGAKLTVRFCMQCHNLPSPSMHTAKDWKVVAGRMFRRMSTTSRMRMMRMSVNVPSNDQQKEILAYLEAYALKPISPGALGSPNSPGAVAFRNTCSQCHALPSPKLHTASDWPAVVRKMQSYAKQMSKKQISNQEAKEIESYLARQSKH